MPKKTCFPILGGARAGCDPPLDPPLVCANLDLQYEIDNGGTLKTKLYDKRDDFTFGSSQLPCNQYQYSSSTSVLSLHLKLILFQDQLPIQRFSGQSYVADTKTTLTRILGFQVEIIDTNILRSLSRNGNVSFAFDVDYFFPL